MPDTRSTLVQCPPEQGSRGIILCYLLASEFSDALGAFSLNQETASKSLSLATHPARNPDCLPSQTVMQHAGPALSFTGLLGFWLSLCSAVQGAFNYYQGQEPGVVQRAYSLSDQCLGAL